MALLGITGKQVQDGKLELKDLPYPPGSGYFLISDENEDLKYLGPLLGDDGSFVLDDNGNLVYLL